MSKNIPTLFAGIALMVMGGLALADSLGLGNVLLPAGDGFPPVLWAAAFAFLAVLALAAYLVSGVARWGWLFPAGVFGGLAGMLGLGTLGLRSSAIATPLFVGLALPFVAAFLLDRTRRWWALIPGGVMAALAVMMLVQDKVGGEWIGAGVLFVLAAAFLVAYLARPERKWAALVAYILAVIGCMPLMATTDRAPLAGVVMLAAIGLPFLGIYLASPARWWAIIPAGLLLTGAALAALAIVFGLKLDQAVANALMLTGCSVTFGVVAVRHQKPWAGAVAVMFAVIAVGVFFFRGAVQFYGPALLVAAGGLLLYRAFRPRKA